MQKSMHISYGEKSANDYKAIYKLCKHELWNIIWLWHYLFKWRDREIDTFMYREGRRKRERGGGGEREREKDTNGQTMDLGPWTDRHTGRYTYIGSQKIHRKREKLTMWKINRKKRRVNFILQKQFACLHGAAGKCQNIMQTACAVSVDWISKMTNTLKRWTHWRVNPTDLLSMSGEGLNKKISFWNDDLLSGTIMEYFCRVFSSHIMPFITNRLININRALLSWQW